ncbi:flagellar export chaperone FlgN [Curtobacterium ammoniigenes]|uniref:flagellar export chaperone FlgN n=1 Tax=Curtobacterium ammoniigenes TaxID=395387 RepID=UPI00082A92A0|nr:flagellar export chaperone FlgN [Curtobacterium ammoniigenes]
MGANELSNELWRQRELLELLLYKYEVEQLLLASGKARWLPHVTREAEAIAVRLKAATLSVGVATSALAEEWGLSGDLRLRDVIAGAPGAWQGIFASHLDALLSLTTEIRSIRGGNDRLIRSALRATQDAFDAVAEPPTVYTSEGTAASTPTRARLVDANL